MTSSSPIDQTTLPRDRGHVSTEHRHASSMQFDALGIGERVGLMVGDHRSVCDAVERVRGPIASFIEALVPRFEQGGRLVYIGAGTSGRLGVLDASECPPTFNADPRRIVGVIAGGDSALRRSSEGLEDDPAGAAAALETLAVGVSDVLLGIAAGGTTPYVLGAIELASGRGAMTGLLTCARIDAPPPACDHLICIDTGPELLTGSTRLKAGSATKLALNIISTSLFVELGKVYTNLMVDLRATNEKLRDRALRILIEIDSTFDRPAADRLLNDAHGDLKTAIVMGSLGVSRTEAIERLRACDGRLRAALRA